MLRQLFIWGNVVLLVIFLVAAVEDLAGPYFSHGWAHYQRAYRKMQLAGETNEESRKSIGSRPVEIKQILATDLGKSTAAPAAIKEWIPSPRPLCKIPLLRIHLSHIPGIS